MEWLFWPPRGLVHHYSALGTRSRITPCARNKLHARYQHSTSRGGEDCLLLLHHPREMETLCGDADSQCLHELFLLPLLQPLYVCNLYRVQEETWIVTSIPKGLPNSIFSPNFTLHYDCLNVLQLADTTIPFPPNPTPPFPLTPVPFSTRFRDSHAQRMQMGSLLLRVMCYGQVTSLSFFNTT